MNANNPFAARITAAAEGYIGSGQTRFPRKVTAAERSRREEGLLSEGQFNYATDLLAEREITAEVRPAWRARLVQLKADPMGVAKLTRTQASALIDCLTELPKVVTAPVATPKVVSATVADGHYAVERTDGSVGFYKVNTPTEGRWAGYTFFERQESDTYVRISRAEQAAAKGYIIADPEGCSRRYGHAIGRCGVCHRTLTNADSRANGIGPVCATKLGW